jgi:hypothetical protein
VTVCDLKKVGVARGARTCQIDLSTEQLLQVLLKSKPLICNAWRFVGEKLDKEIHIAGGWIKFTAGRGTNSSRCFT